MHEIIAEVRRVLANNLWTVALQSSLALIDICGSLEQPSGQASGAAFRAWFSSNMSNRYSYLDPGDAYRLRCGILHQGRLASKNFEAIVFTLPNPNFIVHGNIQNQALVLEVSRFCNDILEAAEAWWDRNSTREPVRANSQSMVRFRADGIFPYMGGVPVIA